MAISVVPAKIYVWGNTAAIVFCWFGTEFAFLEVHLYQNLYLYDFFSNYHVYLLNNLTN